MGWSGRGRQKESRPGTASWEPSRLGLGGEADTHTNDATCEKRTGPDSTRNRRSTARFICPGGDSVLAVRSPHRGTSPASPSLTALRLTACPTPRRPIQPGDYRLTLRISRSPPGTLNRDMSPGDSRIVIPSEGDHRAGTRTRRRRVRGRDGQTGMTGIGTRMNPPRVGRRSPVAGCPLPAGGGGRQEASATASALS